MVGLSGAGSHLHTVLNNSHSFPTSPNFQMRRTERHNKREADLRALTSSTTGTGTGTGTATNTIPRPETRQKHRKPRERDWAELCCFAVTCLQLWPKTVFRKWLNISSNDSEFSADEGDATESEFESEEMCGWERQSHQEERRIGELAAGAHEVIPYMLRRRKSETLRAQYINTKELRICVGTWNVGGKLPSDDLDMKDWLHLEEPADIYVFGFQEIVPLNAGNVFGAEDNRPVPRWEYLIRETLNKFEPAKQKYKCYSDPASPSRFKPADDALVVEDEIMLGSDSDTDDETPPKTDQSFGYQMDNNGYTRIQDNLDFSATSDCASNAAASSTSEKLDVQKHSSVQIFDRSKHLSFKTRDLRTVASVAQKKKLTRTLSCSEKIGLIWPEQSLDVLARHALESPKAFISVKSFRTSNSFKSMHEGQNDLLESGSTSNLLIGTAMRKKRRPPFVRIISKQMVGIYLSIWVRRSLRKHIQNLKVSTVGVGVMGYIGNKGSISVSMSIYQTLFCFICCHLTSGEKEGDELRRNGDVHEIHRRTHFGSAPLGLPKAIHDHERIIWLGDLNYRINLPYEKVHDLISKKEWSTLLEKDQLRRELKKGRAFDGWSEGVVTFPPTYKYVNNTEKYIGDDPKAGRRTPAWCDRILSYGPGIRLVEYKRSEIKLSDHRPVAATFLAEVEILVPRKLQRALTLTDAEIEHNQLIVEPEIDLGMGYMKLGEVSYLLT